MTINKLRKISTSVALILAIILSLSSFTFAAQPNNEYTTTEEKLIYIKSLMDFIKDNYKEDVSEDQLMDGALNGIFEVLDMHSTYYSADELESFDVDALGQFGGVGISVGAQDNYIEVIAPIEGTPAYKAGIKAGDIIKYVDDTDVTGFELEDIVDLMRGEPGTKVRIGVIRGDSTEAKYFNITRDIIKINPVNYTTINDNMGYIRIAQFNENTDENVKVALQELNKQNVNGIIVDLRDNPGGILTEVVKVADLFLDKNLPIVHIDYRSYEDISYESESNPITNKPLAVLVNGGSASASEIFAGAIKDNHRGVIVGTKTYGKGTVQSVTPLINGDGIKLTIAEYLTANKIKIDGIGITPDIIVENIDNGDLDKILSFAPMTEEKTYKREDIGLNIYGAQQRLQYFGYDLFITGTLDNKTEEAIKKFQQSHDLNPNGILDLMTRDKINEETAYIYNNGWEDLQLKKAIEEINKDVE